MVVKMSFVLAMCRRGVLNSKSKRLFVPFGCSPKNLGSENLRNSAKNRV